MPYNIYIFKTSRGDEFIYKILKLWPWKFGCNPLISFKQCHHHNNVLHTINIYGAIILE